MKYQANFIVKTIAVFLLFFNALFADNLQKVSVQLQWKNCFEFSGFYVAKQKGLYKKIGLDVQIKEWENGTNTIDLLDKNKVQFGVLRPASIIDIANGANIKYIGATFQSSPLIILAKKNSKIKSIKDLKGKRLMVMKNQFKDASLLSLLHSNGLKPSDFTIIPHTFSASPLISDRVDAMVAYISDEYYSLKAAGYEPLVFSSVDQGFEFYSNILGVSKEFLDKYPKKAIEFRDATMQGYEYAFSHMEEIVDLVYNHYNTLNKSKEEIRNEAEELKKIAYDENGKIGTIDQNRVQRTIEDYRLLGFIRNKFWAKNIIFGDKVKDIFLNEKEKSYLKSKKHIKLCVDPDWFPFDKLELDGHQAGISEGFVKKIEKFLKTRFEIVPSTSFIQSLQLIKEKKCDVLSSVKNTQSRREFMNFTDPYLSSSLVVVTNSNIPFVSSMRTLKYKRIGISRGHAFIEIAKKEFPDVQLVEVDNIGVALDMVKNGELFGAIDILINISYQLQSKQLSELKVSGQVYDYWDMAFGVRKDDKMLLDIMQKALRQINSKEKSEILHKWTRISEKRDNDHRLLKNIFSFLLALFVIIVMYGFNASSKNKLLKKAQEEIGVKNREINILATTDMLTNLYNRFFIDKTLRKKIENARSNGDKFGVILADLDNFKSINDKYGYQVGDEFLKLTANALKNMTRSVDYVGRYNGEEFLIICPNVDEVKLVELAVKMKENLKSQEFLNEEVLTCSFGVSMFKPKDSFSSLMKRVDNALIEAKKQGKDRVISL